MKTKAINNVEDIELVLEQKETEVDHFRRLQAVLWRAQGKSLKEVTALSGFCSASIKKYCAAYRSAGAEALKSKYVGGNCRKLSYDEERVALESCSEHAEKGGYIRVSDLQAEFEKKTGVHYHLHVFYRLLERHGWRKIMPRGKHPKKADDEAIEASKKLT